MISVIVPVYKVEKYLDQCVASIVSQSFSDLEIILVDDGSPDNCPAMCDAWAKRDSRIRVIHKENGGLSDARNAGMAAAKGSFIGFVDSDDIIPPEMYQVLFSLLKQDDSDIAACGIKQFGDKGASLHTMTSSGKYCFTTEEALHELILERHLKQPVWYKLYRRATIINIPFPVGKYHEDVFWSYQAIGAARRVSVVDSPYYLYRQRVDSIMGTVFSTKRFDVLEAYMQRQHYLELHFPSLVEIAAVSTWFQCMYLYQQSLLHLSSNISFKYLQNILSFCQSLRPLVSAKYVYNFKQKLWLIISKSNFELACQLRNLLKIGF